MMIDLAFALSLEPEPELPRPYCEHRSRAVFGRLEQRVPVLQFTAFLGVGDERADDVPRIGPRELLERFL